MSAIIPLDRVVLHEPPKSEPNDNGSDIEADKRTAATIPSVPTEDPGGPSPSRPRPPAILDCLSSEGQASFPHPHPWPPAEGPSARTPAGPPPPPLGGGGPKATRAAKPEPADPEADIKEAQKVWMEMLAGRQKHIQDLNAISAEAQNYIFESIRETYLRRVKMGQKLLHQWFKAFFGWD